ncbi:MAG: hypothetical protein DCF28_05315 [Alphaproteobacteria bacterium]|nr:MAG: hypothetical protein DCF28_05315 [Alphaproteobacteria bacterium]
MRVFLVAAALFAAVPAFAQTSDAPATRAILADATQAPRGRTIVDGANWRCEGTTCTANGGSEQPAARACRRVKAKLGPLTAFSWKGEVLSAEQLAACNA